MLYKYAEILANEVLFSGMCPEQVASMTVHIWNGLGIENSNVSL